MAGKPTISTSLTSSTMAMQPAAFDAFAPLYDDAFTRSALGHLLRRRVWHLLAHHFEPGQRVLELACGTGVDAVWLAKRDVQVLATDASAAMLHRARENAAAAGVGPNITWRQLSLQHISRGALADHRFDGVLSNFGGLNTIAAWPALAQALAALVRPGGTLLLVPMGPRCPWEIGWYALHRQLTPAFRRFNSPAPAAIGQAVIPVWYPSARQLRRDFAPWFEHQATRSLGLWLPPSYLGHLVARWPRLFAWLNRLEERTARLTGGWGDHYVITFQRNDGEQESGVRKNVKRKFVHS